MIQTRRLRTLDIAHATGAARAPFISAASGLVQAGDTLYVVADDELHIGAFRAGSRIPGALIRCFDGELPGPPIARKKAKPDLEALVLLPRFAGFPHGGLLALGSGSSAMRERAALLWLDDAGEAPAAAVAVSFGALYHDLANHIAPLNIEGAAVRDDRLCLLQRGHTGASSALVEIDLADLLADLAAGCAPRLKRAPAIRAVALGHLGGVPLHFTDGQVLPDGTLLFSAAAEDTGNAIDDGACRGSAIGALGPDGTLRWIAPLDTPCKVEGVSATLSGQTLKLLMVTDADDAGAPAWLLAGDWPMPAA
ncbi:MAG: hypothetical protein JNK75_06105 [Betaproteobacteria bacterium]|nr:hypothetical protein [Betaproteobacteria bacterium]